MPSPVVRVAGKARRFVSQWGEDPAATRHTLRIKAVVQLLRIRNRVPWGRVTGAGAAVVSVTTYGFRAKYVFLSIESIARGAVRPRRLILWLDDDRILNNLPPTLRRLQKRGVEILKCANYGPHKKQYPYAISTPNHHIPLVTADDDVLYPRHWLGGLVASYATAPDDVSGYRAHEVAMTDGHFDPYDQWTPRKGATPSFRVFCTGVGGTLYPPRLLDQVRVEGDRFMAVCPQADDVWMHYLSVRHGFKQRQVGADQLTFEPIPGTQAGTLYTFNVQQGGNDTQIANTYGAEERAAIAGSAR